MHESPKFTHKICVLNTSFLTSKSDGRSADKDKDSQVIEDKDSHIIEEMDAHSVPESDAHWAYARHLLSGEKEDEVTDHHNHQHHPDKLQTLTNSSHGGHPQRRLAGTPDGVPADPGQLGRTRHSQGNGHTPKRSSRGQATTHKFGTGEEVHIHQRICRSVHDS